MEEKYLISIVPDVYVTVNYEKVPMGKVCYLFKCC